MRSYKAITLRLSLLIFTLFMLVACGGGGGSTPGSTPTAKEKAIEKIMAYSEDSGRSPPTLQDYIDAGVTGVTADNLEQLNTVVSSLTADKVDTTAELEALTTQLGVNIKPNASAGGNKTVQVNHSVTITGTGTDSDGTIASYKWEKDGTVISTEASFEYTPTSVGTDTLTFTVIDNDGDSDSESIVVTVTAAPPAENQAPTADAGVNKTVQANNPIRITGVANDNDGTTSVEWKKGSISLSTEESFVYTPTSVGTDTLTFIVTDDDGATATDTMSVLVTAAPQPNQAPTASAGPDKTVQVNNTITIVGTGTDIDGTVTYQWKKGSTVLSTSASFPYTPTTVGTDTLTFIVTDDDGAVKSDSMNVVVTEAPAENQAPTANAGPNKTVQVNSTVTITGSGTDNDGTISSYKWEKGNTVLSTSASFPYTPTTAGTDTLKLTVTDDDGATATDLMDVVVTPVTPDTTPPVITVLGDNPTSVIQGMTYIDAGAIATDNIDGTITGSIVVTGIPANTNGTVGSSFTVTYNVSDAAGNPAVQKTRTVNIIADTIAPVITRIGAQNVDVIQNTTYTDAGATASDNKDGNITANIITKVGGVVGATVDTSAAYDTVFAITYHVSDAAGNDAIPVERFVKIVEPNYIPPISNADIQAYLTEINNARAVGRNCGATFYPAVGPVTWNDNLYRAAYEHTQDMTNSNFFSHDGSGTVNDWTGYAVSPGTQSDIPDRITANGYNWTSWSENITAGTTRDTVQEAMAAWLASPAHCVDIMSSSVNEVGMAHISNASATYTHYWTQNFGHQ